MSTVHRTDVLIVGAGPIGIELAIALKRNGIDYAHLEAGQIGSTISWYAPQTHFFSSPERIAIAGVPLQTQDQTKATREEYLTYLRAVVQQFDLQICTFERVSSIEKQHDGSFVVQSSTPNGDRTWAASQVVLTIGDMHKPRLIGVEGEDLPHVSHYFDDPHVYFRRRVLIVGGKNSAVEAAIRCVRVGAFVTLSYRRADLDGEHVKFWLLPEVRGMIRDGRMRFLGESYVERIERDLVHLRTMSGPKAVKADAVLLLTGYEQDPSLFESAGMILEGPQRKPRLNGETMESSVPGLYVAGTAVAGTQLGGVKEFIETSHVHVERIVATLTGRAVAAAPPAFSQIES